MIPGLWKRIPFLPFNHSTLFSGQNLKGQSPTRNNVMSMARFMIPRNILFLFFSVTILIIFYSAISRLIILSFNNELYSHMVLIPLISGYFVYSKRKTIFVNKKYSFAAGTILTIAGIIFYLFGINQQMKLNQNDYLFIAVSSALISWTGGLIFFYGIQAFRNALFPLLFLAFMIPIPTYIVDKIVFFLQVGTAEAASIFFKLIGITIFREGLIFQLSNVSVEVAKECSGIRSSMATVIIGILLEQIFLRSWWRKAVLILSIIPLIIIKNGIRVTVLTLLGNYVDSKFLTNSVLHKSGGIVFFMPIVIILIVILWLLKRSET